MWHPNAASPIVREFIDFIILNISELFSIPSHTTLMLFTTSGAVQRFHTFLMLFTISTRLLLSRGFWLFVCYLQRGDFHVSSTPS